MKEEKTRLLFESARAIITHPQRHAGFIRKIAVTMINKSEISLQINKGDAANASRFGAHLD